MDQFRPIALANFLFKIITKILADRLSLIAPRIISDQQHAFIKGRHISNCLFQASECVNYLDKKCFGGNVGVKIDIRKAFDTLHWDFIFRVLTAFGFDAIFVNWVSSILHSAKLSVLVNGSPFGFFGCSRGVRQGDPFSPLFFCLAEDVLSRGLSLMVQNGQLAPISSPRGYMAPTHILFADDILIFCKGTRRNFSNLLQFFELYEEASGQKISKDKSAVFFG